MNKRYIKLGFSFFKAAIVVSSYGFVGYRFYVDDNLQNLLMGHFSSNNVVYLILACLLMPMNWFLESYKWRLLLIDTEKIHWSKAFFSVLAGLSVAIFTPNRVGEYIGRIWVLRVRNRPSGVAITIAGSLAQSSITFFVGVICGWLFYSTVSDFNYIDYHNLMVASFAVIIGVVIVLFLPRLTSKLLRFRMNRYLRSAFDGLSRLSLVSMTQALAISFLRYVVFSTQFVLLLWYFDTGLLFSESVMGIGLLYGSMLLIPTIAVAEPGIRGSLSLLIFGVFSTNSAGILAASLTLWIVNLALPALTGALYLSAFKVNKT